MRHFVLLLFLHEILYAAVLTYRMQSIQSLTKEINSVERTSGRLSSQLGHLDANGDSFSITRATLEAHELFLSKLSVTFRARRGVRSPEAHWLRICERFPLQPVMRVAIQTLKTSEAFEGLQIGSQGKLLLQVREEEAGDVRKCCRAHCTGRKLSHYLP